VYRNINILIKLVTPFKFGYAYIHKDSNDLFVLTNYLPQFTIQQISNRTLLEKATTMSNLTQSYHDTEELALSYLVFLWGIPVDIVNKFNIFTYPPNETYHWIDKCRRAHNWLLHEYAAFVGFTDHPAG
jgi:hypothetical protein